jgi:hypothetical protein
MKLGLPRREATDLPPQKHAESRIGEDVRTAGILKSWRNIVFGIGFAGGVRDYFSENPFFPGLQNQ